jgi:large subunit ribosomal protein L18
MSVKTSQAARLKRRRRVRAKVSGTAERPRMSVFRSNRGISVQMVDDLTGTTLVAVNWTEDEFKGLSGIELAGKVGEAAAKRAQAAGITATVFDRGGYQYHGRVQALADGAREGGLSF